MTQGGCDARDDRNKAIKPWRCAERRRRTGGRTKAGETGINDRVFPAGSLFSEESFGRKPSADTSVHQRREEVGQRYSRGAKPFAAPCIPSFEGAETVSSSQNRAQRAIYLLRAERSENSDYNSIP